MAPHLDKGPSQPLRGQLCVLRRRQGASTETPPATARCAKRPTNCAGSMVFPVVESPGAAARATTPNGAPSAGGAHVALAREGRRGRAVGRAASMRQFHANLRAMGYDVKVGRTYRCARPAKRAFRAPAPQFRGRGVLAGGHRRASSPTAASACPSAGRGPLPRRPPVPKGTLVKPVPQVHGAAQQREEAEGARRAGAFPAARICANSKPYRGSSRCSRARDRDAIPAGGIRRALADKVRALQARRRALRNRRGAPRRQDPRAPNPASPR